MVRFVAPRANKAQLLFFAVQKHQMKITKPRALIAAAIIAVLQFGSAVLAEEAASPRSIMIGTASPGGPYYVYGQEIARIISRAMGAEANAQVTQGPAQNIVLLDKREAMLGLVTTRPGLQGWTGTDWAKGTRYRTLRVAFPMYDTAFQFAVPQRVAVKSLNDLEGLRVGV